MNPSTSELYHEKGVLRSLVLIVNTFQTVNQKHFHTRHFNSAYGRYRREMHATF